MLKSSAGLVPRPLIAERALKIANDLRAAGVPVMGVDEPDDTGMVGLTFRLGTGRLMAIRLHYDDATTGHFQGMLRGAPL